SVAAVKIELAGGMSRNPAALMTICELTVLRDESTRCVPRTEVDVLFSVPERVVGPLMRRLPFPVMVLANVMLPLPWMVRPFVPRSRAAGPFITFEGPENVQSCEAERLMGMKSFHTALPLCVT